MKKLYTASDSKDDKFIEFWKREIGLSVSRAFSRRIAASETVVKKLDLCGKLKGHQGCVNTISFNSTGDILVSGSDDKQVILWDWATKTSKLSYPSGHFDNIFQAKFMPFTDDRKIVTSSADGQVRIGHVLENGDVNTKMLGEHIIRVHSLAVEPGSPHILYSCGEDGFVQHVGADEFARIYDIRKNPPDPKTNSPVDAFCPHHLIETKDITITALAYSNTSELLASYNDELIYLFQKNTGLGPNPLLLSHEDVDKVEEPQAYSGHRNLQTIKGVSFFGPNDEYVTSGSDCGHIFMWKKKSAELVRVMKGDKEIVNQLESHPHIPLLATSGLGKTIKLWAPSPKDITPLPPDFQEILDNNQRGREAHSQVRLTGLTPDVNVIMHLLRLHRRQGWEAIGSREGGYNGDIDASNNEEEDGGRVPPGDAIVYGYSDEEGNPRECYVS